MGGRGGPLWRRFTYRLPPLPHPPATGHTSTAAPGPGTLEEVDSSGAATHHTTHFLTWLDRLLHTWHARVPGPPVTSSSGQSGEDGHQQVYPLPFDFWGGLVGYLGYELKAECGGRQAHASPTPDAMLFLADRCVLLSALMACCVDPRSLPPPPPSPHAFSAQPQGWMIAMQICL